MNAMNKPLVMDIFRRHRPFGGFSLIHIGVIDVVTHNAELSVVSLLSVRLQLQMANIAIIGLDRFPSGNRFAIGNGKIFDNVETRVPLTFLDNRPVGPLDLEEPVTLDTDRS